MNNLLKFIVVAVAVVTAIPSFAVTDREMEQARTIAAKHYLRYANNGSDYLDKINPTTMDELSRQLKAKEVENIKSFKAVSVPKDYASWDKAKLVEYWSNTFFKADGLLPDGKKCLSILSKNLNKINVQAPTQLSPKEETAAQKQETAPAAEQTSPAAETAVPAPADTAALAEEAVLAAQNEATEEMLEEEHPQKSSGTGWYVAILIILVGVVIWLVLYAQKSMKETGQIVADHKNGEKEVREAKKSAKEEVNKIREQYAESIAAKNEEIKQLREQCDALQAENERLKEESARNAAKALNAAKAANAAKEAAAAAAAIATPDPVPEKPKAENRQPATSLPPVVYLGYVNQRGLFVKASRSLNVETSVYRMDIPDGVHGSFKVVSDASILDRLLEDVNLWLAGGCDIENPEDADIANEIITIEPGKAVFSDNMCRVVKKARIKFIQ